MMIGETIEVTIIENQARQQNKFILTLMPNRMGW